MEGAELFVLQQIDLQVTNIHYLLVELDGHNAEKDELVRAHLRAAGFTRDIDTMKGCCAGCDCASNELWKGGSFSQRKAMRAGQLRRYNYGTGIQCGRQML